MTTVNRMRIMATGLTLVAIAAAGTAVAQDISAFANGYLTFTNANTALYYRVEFRPNLTGPEAWDGTYNGLKNIQTNASIVTVPVGVFYRVVGSTNPVPVAPVPKTGAGDLPSYTEVAGEDGHTSMRKGVAWPNPRFTDNGNGAVTDNLTGLIWLKDANAFGKRTWADALTDCATLNSGEHGLSDGSAEGEWRLPNIQELQSLTTYQYFYPPIPNTAGTGQWADADPFNNVQSESYFSSTTYAAGTTQAWFVDMTTGRAVGNSQKTATLFVWPVRGGL